MSQFPKHKPPALDSDRPGAREDLYRKNPRNRWEGIVEANKRAEKEVKTPEQVMEDILARLYARLRIASGSQIHIDAETNEQVRVDPKKTKNIIGQASDAIRGILDQERRKALQEEIHTIRVKFREIGG